MSNNDKYSLVIVPDDKKEDNFSKSKCDCDDCKRTHFSQKEWDFFIPQTKLQSKMKEAISSIEKKYT
jgi:hypothetical protein